MVENQFDRKIKIFQFDGGLEFDYTSLKDQCLASGLIFRKSCPDTETQNGAAESKHKHLLEIFCSISILASLQLLGGSWI